MDGEGSILTRPMVGKLPGWVIGLIGIALALVYKTWQANKAAAAGTSSASSAVNPALVPTYVIQNQNYLPPDGGRDSPPTATPPPATAPPPPRSRPPGVRPPGVPVSPHPVTGPIMKPAPVAAPAGQWMTVVPYRSGQPAGTPSTLWGMAQAAYRNGNDWSRIWTAPQNAALVAKRGAPNRIQPGDRLFVPA